MSGQVIRPSLNDGKAILFLSPLCFAELWTITLKKGEKMICEVILLRNEMRGEIAEYYFYQTRFMNIPPKLLHLNIVTLTPGSSRGSVTWKEKIYWTTTRRKSKPKLERISKK